MEGARRSELVWQWCRASLGAAPVEVFFVADSMSSVDGVVLEDRRRVALKRRRASDRVLACADAQRMAWRAGIDCPELLAGPSLLSDGSWVSAEVWRDGGTLEPPGDAAARYAGLLRRLVVALADCDPVRFAPPPPWAWYDHGQPDRVWPPPASARWDPASAMVPVELGRVAQAARERLTAEALPAVVGHSDLNGLNVRWGAGGPIVHDWDSLAGRPECVLAGIVAVNHVELPAAGAIAAVGETERFLELYQESRPFSPAEVEVAWAAGVWVAAYNAAFEHLHGAAGAVSRRLLADWSERLRRAGC